MGNVKVERSINFRSVEVRYKIHVSYVLDESDTSVRPVATGLQESVLVPYGAINVELLLHISRMHRRFVFIISEARYLPYVAKCVYLVTPKEYTNTPVYYAVHQLFYYNETSFFAALIHPGKS